MCRQGNLQTNGEQDEWLGISIQTIYKATRTVYSLTTIFAGMLGIVSLEHMEWRE